MEIDNRTTSPTLPKIIIPSEPHPLPSLSSDEESFVVLGHSLSDSSDADSAKSDEVFEHVSADVIDEARRLFESELTALERSTAEKMTLNEKVCATDSAGDSPAVDDEPEGAQTPKAGSSMEQSTINLPEMPCVDESLKNSGDLLSLVSSNQPSDWSPAEVQSQISNIIKENLHLKEVLTQNNLSMNSQIKRVLAWQEDVVRVHEAHKQKLIDAKALIEKLKQEVEVLSSRNGTLSRLLAERQKRVVDQGKYLQETNRKINDILVARSKGIDLQAALKKSQDNEAAIRRLAAENDELMVENLRLSGNKREKQLETAVERLTAENAQLKADLSKLTEGQCQIEMANARIEELETINKKLIAEVDRMNGVIYLTSVSDGESKTNFESTVRKLTKENEELKEAAWKLGEIAKVHENCQVIAHDLGKNCQDYAFKLSGAQERISLLEIENKSLTETYGAKIQELNNVISAQGKDLRKASDYVTELRASLSMSEQHRAAALAELKSSAAQARSARVENERLAAAMMKQQMALKEHANEVDELYALRTQVEVSKADFEAEKNAKEVLKGEKETLIADLQNLQRRNQQLQEEIELLRDNRDYVVYPSTRRSDNEVPTAPASSQDPMRKCPKCSFGFNTQQALENHVYRCIELDDQLP